MSYNIDRWFVFIIVFALTEVFKMSQNQQSNLFGRFVDKFTEFMNDFDV